jgi:hypothetical protein
MLHFSHKNMLLIYNLHVLRMKQFKDIYAEIGCYQHIQFSVRWHSERQLD